MVLYKIILSIWIMITVLFITFDHTPCKTFSDTFIFLSSLILGSCSIAILLIDDIINTVFK